MRNLAGAVSVAASGAIGRLAVVVREGVAMAPQEPLTFSEVLAKAVSRAPSNPAKTALPATPRSGTPSGPKGGTAKGGHGGSAPVDGRHEDEALPQRRRTSREDDLLDPSIRHAAQMAPLPMSAPPSAAPIDVAQMTSARGSLESLLPLLVKRVAVSHGDGRRRAMHLEIGEGELAGATLLVQADAGRVHVRLDAPSHVDAGAWRARIEERLARKGIAVDAIEIGGR